MTKVWTIATWYNCISLTEAFNFDFVMFSFLIYNSLSIFNRTTRYLFIYDLIFFNLCVLLHVFPPYQGDFCALSIMWITLNSVFYVLYGVKRTNYHYLRIYIVHCTSLHKNSILRHWCECIDCMKDLKTVLNNNYKR